MKKDIFGEGKPSLTKSRALLRSKNGIEVKLYASFSIVTDVSGTCAGDVGRDKSTKPRTFIRRRLRWVYPIIKSFCSCQRSGETPLGIVLKSIKTLTPSKSKRRLHHLKQKLWICRHLVISVQHVKVLFNGKSSSKNINHSLFLGDGILLSIPIPFYHRLVQPAIRKQSFMHIWFIVKIVQKNLISVQNVLVRISLNNCLSICFPCISFPLQKAETTSR